MILTSFSKRQDNLTVRNELEKEIKKLQDEISALKVENKQLKLDKEDVEKQFIDFKAKSDDTVTKLRGMTACKTINFETIEFIFTLQGRLPL